MSNLEQYNKLRAEFEAAHEIIPSRWSNYQAHITVLLLLVSMYQIALSSILLVLTHRLHIAFSGVGQQEERRNQLLFQCCGCIGGNCVGLHLRL